MDIAPFLTFLAQHNAETLGHTQHSLLTHLEGTYRLLDGWGEPEHVCVAGLFHSVYGTESYRQTLLPLDLRPRVEALIGGPAERLAYTFGAMEKTTFDASVFRGRDFEVQDRHTGDSLPMDAQTFRELSAMVVGNWLEQLPRLEDPRWRTHKSEMFQVLRGHLGDGARLALDEAYGFS